MRKKTVVLLREGENKEKKISKSQVGEKWKTSASTPHLYLPRIGPHGISNFIPGTEGVDRLESYIHRLIAQKHQQTFIMKRQKKIREDFEARKENETKNETLQEKKRHDRRIRDLEERLKDLRGELGVQEKKLQLQYSIQDRMMVQYKQYYDNLHNRVRGVVKQDESAQTDQIIINTQVEESTTVSAVNIKEPGHYKRKFRIAVYTVYFSLAFPKYVRAFREIRKKHFFQSIVQNQQLSKPIQNYFKLLSSFKLAELQRERERISRRSNELAPSFSFEQIDQDGNNKIKNIPLDSIIEMVLFLLTKIKESLVQGQLDSLVKTLSFYLTPNAFLSDDFFLIDELYRLKIDQNTLQLILNAHQSKQLLLNFLISKLTCFNFMIVGPKQTKNLIKRNSKIAREHQNQSLTRSLLLGGLFLFNRCNQIFFDSELQEKLKRRGNIEVLGHDLFPVPMRELEMTQKFDLSGTNDKNGKRTSIQTMIDFAGLNIPGIKYKNMAKTLEILNNFNTENEHLQKIDQLMKNIGELAYEKCWHARVDHFNIIEQSAIQHPKLLTEEIQNLNFVKKKLPNELAFIQTCIPLIERARSELPQLPQSNKTIQSSVKKIEVSKKSLASSKSNPTSSRKSQADVTQTLTKYDVLSHQRMIFDEKSSNASKTKKSEKSQKINHSRGRGSQSGEIKLESEKSESSNGIISPIIRLTGTQRAILRNRLKDADQQINKKK